MSLGFKRLITRNYLRMFRFFTASKIPPIRSMGNVQTHQCPYGYQASMSVESM